MFLRIFFCYPKGKVIRMQYFHTCCSLSLFLFIPFRLFYLQNIKFCCGLKDSFVFEWNSLHFQSIFLVHMSFAISQCIFRKFPWVQPYAKNKMDIINIQSHIHKCDRISMLFFPIVKRAQIFQIVCGILSFFVTFFVNNLNPLNLRHKLYLF